MARTAVVLLLVVGVFGPVEAQRTPPVSAGQVRSAIDSLGSLEFPVRTAAARTVRRAPPDLAVPALLQAVTQHSDGYVRFRALVLLSGFNDPRTRDAMAQALAEPNDRLRAVAYTYFEHNRDKTVASRLLDALKREESEFVRPPLTRALAAYGDLPEVRKVMSDLVMRGQAFFRSVVIEALGDYEAAYALKPIIEVAKVNGPLQDDAALALGKIGDKAALPILAQLQRSAPRESQPAIAAAICLLGVNCASHQPFIVRTLEFAADNPGFQELLRSSAAALAVLAVDGHEASAAELVRRGGPARDPARAALALGLGTVALRNTPLLLRLLEEPALLEPAVELLREAFDMLDEDYEEERFFATVRRAYWQAPEGSTPRKVAETLVQKLEF
ncbi:MAG TPA: HEAT repeat domain-containing protein [Vicinamibacterales bacterium]|nr:HEAT repeat domain-containing protein [Vicinamibacterales bacterium]